MTKKPRTFQRRQYGVVPYRMSSDGGLEVLLITSRETRRWIVPKGWPIRKLGPLGTGLREALEEAGVVGEGGPSVGDYRYLKIMRSGAAQRCRVELFAMKVREEQDDWPEKSERERRWFGHRDASDLVEEEDLRQILLDLPDRLAKAAR